jgi:hypothetical protein
MPTEIIRTTTGIFLRRGSLSWAYNHHNDGELNIDILKLPLNKWVFYAN